MAIKEVRASYGPTSLSFEREATPWRIWSLVKVYGKLYSVSRRNNAIVEATLDVHV